MSSDELKDQLRKLGLRVRLRTEKSPQPRPGEIKFDPRGNPVYDWRDPALTEDGETGERARLDALHYHGLRLVDDDPPPNAPMRINPNGLRLGYNPYESGLLVKRRRRKNKDLRELSKWIEMKRRLAKDRKD